MPDGKHRISNRKCLVQPMLFGSGRLRVRMDQSFLCRRYPMSLSFSLIMTSQHRMPTHSINLNQSTLLTLMDCHIGHPRGLSHHSASRRRTAHAPSSRSDRLILFSMLHRPVTRFLALKADMSSFSPSKKCHQSHSLLGSGRGKGFSERTRSGPNSQLAKCTPVLERSTRLVG